MIKVGRKTLGILESDVAKVKKELESVKKHGGQKITYNEKKQLYCIDVLDKDNFIVATIYGESAIILNQILVTDERKTIFLSTIIQYLESLCSIPLL